MSKISSSLFLLGSYDLEMLEIKNIQQRDREAQGITQADETLALKSLKK